MKVVFPTAQSLTQQVIPSAAMKEYVQYFIFRCPDRDTSGETPRSEIVWKLLSHQTSPSGQIFRAGVERYRILLEAFLSTAWKLFEFESPLPSENPASGRTMCMTRDIQHVFGSTCHCCGRYRP